jgi:hypothetical protein
MIVILQNEANFITSFQLFRLPRAVVEGAALVGEDGKEKRPDHPISRHYPASRRYHAYLRGVEGPGGGT